MLSLLLSGDGTVLQEPTTRAQLPLLLNQLVVTTQFELDIAVETDTAQNIGVFIGAHVVQIDTAVETDIGQNFTVINPPGQTFLPIDQAIETDAATDITLYESTSGSYPGVYPGSTTYPWSGAYFQLDIAEETDSAFSITLQQTFLTPKSEEQGIELSAHTQPSDVFLVPVIPV